MPCDAAEGKAGPLLRRAEEASDQPFLQALFTAGRAPQFAALGLPAPMLEMMMRQQFQAQTAGHRGQYPAARREIVETQGAPIGHMVSDRAETGLHLVDIALTPAWQGQGLGATLMGQLMAEAREAGLPMTLSVACDNLPAMALYRKLGFETVASGDVYQDMRWTPPAVG